MNEYTLGSASRNFNKLVEQMEKKYKGNSEHGYLRHRTGKKQMDKEREKG